MSAPFHVFDLESSAFNTELANSYTDGIGSRDLLNEFLQVSSNPESSGLKQHPLFRAHERSNLLQIYGTGGIFRDGDQGWVKPYDEMRRWGTRNVSNYKGLYDESGWASGQGLVADAIRFGTEHEHKRVEQFYQGIETSIRRYGKAVLGGHNISRYDLWRLEYSTYQHDSLRHRRGWLANQVKAGRLQLRDSDTELLSHALDYAQKDGTFAREHFAGVTSAEKAYGVKGHNLTNAARQLGWENPGEHNAFFDAMGTSQVFEGLDSGVARSPEYLKKTFQSKARFSLGEASKTEVSAVSKAMLKPSGSGGVGRKLSEVLGKEISPREISALKKGAIGIAAAAAISAYLVYGTRRDRQTQITGLRDEGMAVGNRHAMTSFGSGWQGIDTQLETEQAYNPWLRGIGILAAGGATWEAHKHALRNSERYASKLYGWAAGFEEKSPYRWGRTLGLSERIGAYLPTELTFGKTLLVRDGRLDGAGVTLQRQFGGEFDILKHFKEGGDELRFKRLDKADVHLTLAQNPNIKTMFVPSREAGSSDKARRLASVAEVHNAKLSDELMHWSTEKRLRDRIRQNFNSIRQSQALHSSYSTGSTFNVLGKEMEFLPFHSVHAAKVGSVLSEPLDRTLSFIKNTSSRVDLELLELTQRPQVMFGSMGLGLKHGEWNKFAHIPFKGSGGYINNILLKRALPIVAGVTALKYADYLMGHAPSNTVINSVLSVNTLRADIADIVPGARAVTNFYDDVVPGAQYGPMALPLTGAFLGGLYHYQKVVRGVYDKEARATSKVAAELRTAASRLHPSWKTIKEATDVKGLKALWKEMGHPGKGAAIGLAAMLPFVPGMLFPRKTGQELRDIYSGVEPVPVRSGRWWELGSSALEGGRIKEWRSHRAVLMKSHAYEKSLWGSEQEYWKHNPILHPVRWLRDPYALEKQNYEDRPYPVTSPAFTNVPLIGPMLAATVGQVVKPIQHMHEEEWDGKNYTLYSTRLEPRGSEALPPPPPKNEYSISNVIGQELNIFAEFTGLPGFLAKSAVGAAFPDYGSPAVYYQGSRQIDNFSRYYYDLELGAGVGPAPHAMTASFGYTEPFRRFVQRELPSPQANQIRNKMPAWLPAQDYFTDFQHGDPYSKISEGYARLPGAGYAAQHPDLEGVDANDYPDIYKLAILGDVAPYSREFQNMRHVVGSAAHGNTELEIEYEKVLERVRKTKESVVRMDHRRFTEPVDEIEGTVAAVGADGFTVKEYPGRHFQFSSIGTSAADMSASIIGEHNDMTRADVAAEIGNRRQNMHQFLLDTMGPGTSVKLTIPEGAADSSEQVRAVVNADGTNVNRALVDEGYASFHVEYGGAEARAMYAMPSRVLGGLSENLSFTGDSSVINPMRYLPSPANTKLWQERTPLAQYINQEVIGTKLRRWERPIHDFLAPYVRGVGHRALGQTIIPSDVQFKRDLNTLTDTLQYLRSLQGGYTNQKQRTSVGANLFASPTYLASTLPENEAHYFRSFLRETDIKKREKILQVASPEMARTLSAQWVAEQARIAAAEGHPVGEIGEGGRLFTKAGVEEFKSSGTRLDYGNWLRSKEIANVFDRTGFAKPDEGSEVYNPDIDYQDVKLKIIQQEGYDSHDFNIFDDRTSLLWRKPYIDGAVRELTVGESRSADQLRLQVEQLMIGSGNRNANVNTSVHASQVLSSNVRVDIDVDDTPAMLKDMRRNPDHYQQE